VEGSWLDGASGIVLDRNVARKMDVEPGDSVSLLRADGAGLVEARVAGIAVVPWREPYPDSHALVFAAPETFAAVASDGESRVNALSIRLRDPEAAEAFAMRIAPVPTPHIIGMSTWTEVREDVTEWHQIYAVFLGLFSAFALFACGLIVANVIAARVLAQYRDIGLLKAVGFTPLQVAAIFLLEHLLVAIVAGVFGIGIAVLIAPFFLRDLAESMNTTAQASFDPVVAGIVLLSVLTIVALFTAIPAWRGGRIATVQAIAIGFAPPSDRPSRLVSLAARLRIPAVITLGLKDAFARPWRAALSILALVMTVVTVISALALDATFDRVFSNPALQGEPWDITVDRRLRTDAEATQILATHPEVASFHTRAHVRGELAASRERYGVRALGGDVATAGYLIDEGRMFSAPGEAVAAWGFLRSLNLTVGDSVEMRLNGRPVTLTIVGEYLEDDDDGQILMTSLETVQQVLPEVVPTAYLVNLRDRDAAEEVGRDLTIASAYDFNVWTPADEAEGDRGPLLIRSVMFGLSAILLGIGLINLLALALLTVRERVRDFGIYKSIGLSPRQTVVAVSSGVSFIAIIAAVIGIPAGLFVHWFFYRVIAENEMGAVPDWYTLPSVWELALIVPGAVLVAALAAMIPARQVSQLTVSQVLRYE
jgi:putative ABC transport system permease protein